MTGNDKDLEKFSERAGKLLRSRAEDLDASTRNKLARARATALDQASAPRGWLTLRHLAPAGAVASAVLVTLLLTRPDPVPDSTRTALPATLQDLELLADADAWELSQEADLEFIEWAAGMAELEGTGG